MNIQEKIERDKRKYSHIRNRQAKPRYRISNIYRGYLASAKHFGYKLDFTKEEFIRHVYSIGYSELYARWRDSGVKSSHVPSIRLKKVTESITLDNVFLTTRHEMEEDYKQGLKRCAGCDVKKSLGSFSKAKHRLFKLQSSCKECALGYARTAEGLLLQIYSAQRSNSRLRKRPVPSYTKQELSVWMQENGLETLYKDWVASGYEKSLRPSTDRLDSLKPYTLDNLELVTWEENQRRGYEDRRNGVGASGKICKPIFQYTLEGDFVAEYHSAHAAERATGVLNSSISAVINGRNKSAGGFIWKDKSS